MKTITKKDLAEFAASASCSNYTVIIEARSFRGLKSAATRAFNGRAYRDKKILIKIDGVLRFINESSRYSGKRGTSWEDVQGGGNPRQKRR